MNNVEAGRTPFTTDFTWYGDYDVVVRKDGFKTITTKKKIAAPWWQFPPIDLVAEITPGQKIDQHELNFTLTKEEEVSASADPGAGDAVAQAVADDAAGESVITF